jgi:hypothetical protein
MSACRTGSFVTDNYRHIATDYRPIPGVVEIAAIGRKAAIQDDPPVSLPTRRYWQASRLIGEDSTSVFPTTLLWKGLWGFQFFLELGKRLIHGRTTDKGIN